MTGSDTDGRTLSGIVLDYAGVLTDSGGENLLELVDIARDHGVRTALLSNAAGGGSVRRRLHGRFDDLVFSGEVAVMKPEPEIFLLTAERLGVPPEACVFVDDAPGNVWGAVAAGMVGIRHSSVAETIGELLALFPDLRAGTPREPSTDAPF
ncbi:MULTISPECIES: HAD-IA family hydrolase [Prauserella salsuginis group]|uniref:FMN phosphatase YigB (HAD superfamily) n=2 Tax=Prauserella salsuginis group TaxID=2893672 RepID=A0A839XVU4_9PSEU|nr:MULTISPECIES: HAD-IA family hydrolase [Prauserella salsuginis group]MBB3663915.1 FMN phosphatase YigB (HAD superfamily) [Prauserella sediminis]MCR3721372.1 haloacid dehalogenase superfamily, subfamily IA, variant 3 with third motif having DD or ED [Prauserella flava]MCR3732363.1 haloacid dehalogenase superfamily, subfamily IA, variant 3 with third motif having DD or ED [Prauserella salsuginis]